MHPPQPLRRDDTAPAPAAESGEATCDIRNEGEERVFPLDRDQPAMALDTTDVAGETYAYAGPFTADRTGLVEVRCNGIGEGWSSTSSPEHAVGVVRAVHRRSGSLAAL